MSMHDATNIATSWLEWGSAYSLPEPHYVTVGLHTGMPQIGYQFNTAGDVQEWARYLRVDAESTTRDGDVFTRAKYSTGGYAIECYSVTKFMPSQPTLDQADAS